MVDREDRPGQILYLPLKLVQPSSVDRGRLTVQLQELAASIEAVGVLQPLTVRKSGREYVVVSGNRRLMAARMAGLGEVPCLLLTVDAGDAELIALTENLQREDLHYFDEAQCLQDFLKHSGLTQAQAAVKLGRSQSAVANKLRLLKLAPEVLEAVKEGGLSERHARSLLRLPEGQRLEAARYMAQNQLTVAKAEAYVDKLISPPPPPQPKKEPVYHIRDVRFFLNTIDRSVRLMQSAGVQATSCQDKKDGVLTLTVRIPVGETVP